jgi:MOSC domain-containing protein YiiM
MASAKRVVSVNVGQPREIHWRGRRVTTCIFKEPVAGRIAVRRLHLEGDRQANLKVHGGPDKAVYIYPVEHYDYWRKEFPGMSLPLGWFGENLTTEGLLETEVHIGDRLRIGSAEVRVTSPRVPCSTLAAKFECDDMIKRFLASRRTGFYLAVLQEGEVGAGDAIEVIGRDENQVTVFAIARLYTPGPPGSPNSPSSDDLEDLRRAAQLAALPENWRARFRERIKKAEAGSLQPD